MAQSVALTWNQGADLKVQLIYKEGATAETAVVVPLNSGYAVRMDIVIPATKERIYTFNSADIADVDSILVGDQPDTLKEATLTSGAGGTPNVNIVVPRTLTLPGGAVYAEMTGSPAVSLFNFDVFLRNTGTDTQDKILKGTITIEESYTLWL